MSASVSRTTATPIILVLQHDELDPPCFLMEYLETASQELWGVASQSKKTGRGETASAASPSRVEPVLLKLWLDEDKARLPNDVQKRVSFVSKRMSAVVSEERQAEDGKIVGIVSCGGDLDADDVRGNPYFKDVMQLFLSALKHEVPVLGICLGSQLLAQALGGTVSRLEKENVELGWVDMTPAPPLGRKEGENDSNTTTPTIKPWFNGAEKVRYFQFHGDTFSIPDGCIRIASSPQCLNQAFQVGNSFSIGLQFHCEADPWKAKKWAELGHPGFETAGPGVVPMQKIIDTADEEAAKSKETAISIYNCWASGLALS